MKTDSCSHSNSCDNCVICMNEIKPTEYVFKLPCCQNSLHQSCFKKCRENMIDAVCPLCRAKLPLRSLEDELYDVARSYKQITKTGYKSKDERIVHLYIKYKSFSEMFLDNHVNVWYSYRVVKPNQKQPFKHKEHKRKKIKNFKRKL